MNRVMDVRGVIGLAQRHHRRDQPKRAVTSVTGRSNAAAIGPDMMPMGANIPDMTKYARKLLSVVRY